MKPSSQPPRSPARLSDSVHHQLNMYAVSAGAASVSLLALAQPAEAKIIYTPAHKSIEIPGKLPLDLNRDGKTDFIFSNFVTHGSWPKGDILYVDPGLSGNEIWGYKTGNNNGIASALHAGVRVGPRGPLSSGAHMMAGGSTGISGCWGPWDNVKRRYLGLKFTIKGRAHFGWARLDVSCIDQGAGILALLTGYAYETVPNKSIITGKTKEPDAIALEPGSLGRLAQGSAGLAAWRLGR